ncbi:helix-turn-helix domain-containing protein, partial [Streptomyces sp. NPDC006324]|uniref:helix-turn-helix domain-containing protein n=1 Tax=Streptomyces sp. NPDC006324 TaxID=3156751 RepID=UPI0033BD12BE
RARLGGQAGDLLVVRDLDRGALDHQALVQAVLARRMNMSTRNLTRRFTATTGTTPLRWLHTQRIHRAQELLETTDDSVELIAVRTGMGTSTTLRRHFHHALGVPPDTYRRTFRSAPRSALGDTLRSTGDS